MYADTFVHDVVEKAYPFRVSLAEPDAEKRVM